MIRCILIVENDLAPYGFMFGSVKELVLFYVSARLGFSDLPVDENWLSPARVKQICSEA